MIIDAHQHFWHYQPERDTWITEEMSVLVLRVVSGISRSFGRLGSSCSIRELLERPLPVVPS